MPKASTSVGINGLVPLQFTSLPNDKKEDAHKWKAFADDKLNVTYIAEQIAFIAYFCDAHKKGMMQGISYLTQYLYLSSKTGLEGRGTSYIKSLPHGLSTVV